MKILAKFLLPGLILFLAAAGVVPLCAQHYRGMIPDSYQELREYDSVGVKSDEQNAIENLEKSNKDLKDKLRLLEITNDSHESEIRNLGYDLKQAKVDLDAAKADLEMKLDTAEADLHIAKANIEILQQQVLLLAGPSARRPASKPKAPVNEPKPAIQEGTH